MDPFSNAEPWTDADEAGLDRETRRQIALFRRLPQTAAATLLGISARRLRELIDCPRNPDGTYNAQTIIAWWRDRQARLAGVCPKCNRPVRRGNR